MPIPAYSFGPWSWFVHLYFVISLFVLLKYVLKRLPRVFYCNRWTFLLCTLSCSYTDENEAMWNWALFSLSLSCFYYFNIVILHHGGYYSILSTIFLTRLSCNLCFHHFFQKYCVPLFSKVSCWSQVELEVELRTLLKFELVYHHDHDETPQPLQFRQLAYENICT